MNKTEKAEQADDKSKINDLIFKELIKRGYSLEGNTRVWNIADSKLWYLTPEQAQAYLDVEKSEKYKKEMIDTEIDLLKEVMPKIKEKLNLKQEVVMVDVGCGDGKKAVVPINEIKDETKIIYCPIDISSYMVERAMKNISGQEGVKDIVNFQWNVSDFENLENVTQLLRIGKKELFILFLGSTLGNFETHEVLYALQNSMAFGDSLLIGVALSKTKPEDLEETYKSKHSDNFLGKVLEELGFDRSEIEFGARFRHSRVESFYTINVDKSIKFQDKTINFNNGDQIIVAYSQKFSEKSLEDAIKLYFGKYNFYVNEDKSWALVFCQK